MISLQYYSLPKTTRLVTELKSGPDSSVGIAIRYELDGQGSNPGGGRDFPHPSRLALGPKQPPVQRVAGLLPGVKRGVDHPPHLELRLNKECSYIALPV
jgi:hypothetical protein